MTETMAFTSAALDLCAISTVALRLKLARETDDSKVEVNLLTFPSELDILPLSVMNGSILWLGSEANDWNIALRREGISLEFRVDDETTCRDGVIGSQASPIVGSDSDKFSISKTDFLSFSLFEIIVPRLLCLEQKMIYVLLACVIAMVD
jgi:hypothetical protein